MTTPSESPSDPNTPKPKVRPVAPGQKSVSEREGYVPDAAQPSQSHVTRPVIPPAPASPGPSSSLRKPKAEPEPVMPAVRPAPAAPSSTRTAAKEKARAARKQRARAMSRASRLFLTFALLFFIGFFAVVAIGMGGYIVIAAQVPDVGALREKQSTFASTRIYDAEGGLLLELTDPNNPTAGIRQRVGINEISPFLRQATIATEDPNFYRYSVGFDPIAIVRVLYYAWEERDFVSGGSTITQQVARNLLLTPEERSQRTLSRKLREIVLANEISRRYSRDEILEIYLNELNYANLAYGAEAASRTYFGKRAKELTLAEASFIAGIPQSPVLWDPVANKTNTLRRQAEVLRLMSKAGFIPEGDIEAAQAAMRAREFQAPKLNVPNIAPHFFYYVREQLDREFGAKGLYGEGFKVYTSLNPIVQRIAEQAVREQLARLKDKNVSNAAVVVLRPQTGEILAMVGSADFNDPSIDGQVNVAISSQQPGSSIKPFTYLAALEKGWTPATLFWDVPKTYTNQYGQQFKPRNYDGKFHGPMLMREALARSMNIPAVDALEFVTVPEFITMTNRVGIKFPPNPQYGLAITLGGAESTLLNLSGAYAVLANNGVYMKPTAITRVETLDGKLVRDYTKTQGEQVVKPEHAYLITHMLSDNAARAISFGRNNVLNLPFPAAAKTGTTNDFRDNLTVGYTPDFVTGVWVGNNDNSEMEGVTGLTGAAPIWRDVMLGILKDQPAREFVRPAGVVELEVCAEGGRAPSSNCTKRVKEVFKSDQLPLPADENVERAVAAKDPKLAAAPAPAVGPAQAQEIAITQPANGAAYGRGLLSIRGTVNPAGFNEYQVEYGDGDNPGEWKWISGPHRSPVIDDQLTQWGIENLPPGRYTIRVTVSTSSGTQVGYSRFDVAP